jgi:hypothetical protein
MPARSRYVVPILLVASLSASAVVAQTPAQPQAQPQAKEQRGAERARLSPEARARLLDGRMAMIKETLKLNDTQLRLWGPVEQNIRANYAERQQRREERRQRREQGSAAPSLPDRLERASQRMVHRAERLKAFNDVFKPFYASLTDEQKAVTGVILRETRSRGERGFHRPLHRDTQHQ